MLERNTDKRCILDYVINSLHSVQEQLITINDVHNNALYTERKVRRMIDSGYYKVELLYNNIEDTNIVDD